MSTIEEELDEFRFITKLNPPSFDAIMERDVPSILAKGAFWRTARVCSMQLTRPQYC